MRALAVVNAEGFPKRWEGGPFHHCFEASIQPYHAQLEAVADRMTAITGIPRTEAGPCNVTWKVAADPYVEVPIGCCNSRLFGTDVAIYKAEVTFPFGEFVLGGAAHESGHVLGLAHSPVKTDLMWIDGSGDFSRDELAVLAWIYGR